jgi:hypothetical protein
LGVHAPSPHIARVAGSNGWKLLLEPYGQRCAVIKCRQLRIWPFGIIQLVDAQGDDVELIAYGSDAEPAITDMP